MTGKKLAMIGIAAAAAAALFAWPKSEANAGTTAASSAKPAVSIVAMGGSCSSEFCFQPSSLTIFQAQTVTWTNTTGATHTVTRCTASACSGNNGGTGTDPAFNSSFLSPGATFSLEFHGTGTYLYYCMVHGYTIMHGTVSVDPFAVRTARLPTGTVGTAYSASLKTEGGASPLHWTVASGALPHGLRLGSRGHIMGTPTKAGKSTFTVKVTDASSPVLSAERMLAITVG